MRLLLDTHVLLWWLADDARLGLAARAAISSPENGVFISAASVWEMVIKQSLGKLDVPDHFAAVLAAEDLAPLPVTAAHALAVGGLPSIHHDPFDRLLVAQCLVEGLTLVTANSRLAQYPAAVLPA